MANRFRNERIEIKVTKEEKEVFEKKMKLANCKTMSHFLRKCLEYQTPFDLFTHELSLF